MFFDISIIIISINIEKLTKVAENSTIRTYNKETIPSLLENLKISVSNSKNKETLSNIITLYQTLLTRDTLRSSIHAKKI